ncbi:uncharacterized protein LOC130922680 [Corythoichthys intestinalis]|uniref:uncharacterized protein LOC130922680 n=1 Tax=Corythoichthys intestinalis TaxID=161448 RepID=UPI0025A4DAF1|nr:uncharacterized protein LOC130922680 [Corythoichthys intestinalis]
MKESFRIVCKNDFHFAEQLQFDIPNLCAETNAVFSKTMAESMEGHLQCPTCRDFFRDPVMLPCSHNFCRACLQQRKDAGEQSCPVCRTEFRSLDAPPNLALKNLCENFPRASSKSEEICSMHQKELKLLCLDHQDIVCIICRDSEIHVGHTFLPLKEVVKGHRKKLQKGLQKAIERLQIYNDCRENCNEQAEYIKVQRENVERKIKKDFEELRRFLDVEEEARLAAVREEEQKKSKIMNEKIVVLGQQMTALSDVIRSTEEQLASGKVSFLKNFKTAMSRIQELPEKPKLLPGGLLDVAKHVGNLKFKVWELMKETLGYSPVILDPNTANPRMSLSEDLTSLSWKDVQQERPENPERFQTWRSVLGAALDSGRHVWDVEVGDNNSWAVGIRWGDPCLPEKMRGWVIGFRDGEYLIPSGEYRARNLPVKLQRIRVEVDINESSLSFSEPLTNTELWKKPFDWPDLFRNTKIYPSFHTICKIPLKLIPFPPCVTTDISLQSCSSYVEVTNRTFGELSISQNEQLQFDIPNLCAETNAVFSKTMAESMEDHLQCPTCLGVFRDPVMLPCSHNFCRACLQEWKDAGKRSCPVCRTEFQSIGTPLNLALKNLCENFPRASIKSEDICSMHQEELKLFCMDHQDTVCIICRDSEIHVGHTFRPLKEIVKGHHEELKEGLQEAKERLQDYKDCRENCNEQAEYIKVQRENVERKIKKDFEELRRFLDVEEEARLAAVREEEQKKSKIMKEKIVVLGQQMTALSDVIRSTEEQLASGNVSFLKNFKTAMSRIQEMPEKPQLLPGGLLDVAKHVGNLKFKVWELMKETLGYSPVILDPNTANPRMSLSEDLTSLSWKDVQQERPENPERFQTWQSVLGAALDSGRHVWDVEVGDNNSWIVGIRWGHPCLPEEMRGSGIGFRDGEYLTPSCVYGAWNPPVKLQRIRVEVDINESSLSFSDPLTNTELWNSKKNPLSLPDFSRNIKIYPYFHTIRKIPLKVIPIPPGVTTDISLQSC